MSSPTDNNGAPPSQSPSKKLIPQKALCSRCKQEQLRFIGLAVWDTDIQYYDFDTVPLDAFCLHCLTFTEVNWIPLQADSP